MVEKLAGWTPRGEARARSAWVLPGVALAWLLGSVLALGGAPYWFAVAVLSLVLASALFIRREIRRGWSALSTLLLALATFTALQLLPLPLPWLRVMSPTVGAYWADAARIPGLSRIPGWAPLTLDQGATALEVLKWTSYAIVSATAGRLSKNRGLSVILGIVGLTGTIASAIGLGHVLTSAERVFGIYAPIAQRTVTGPLVNPNHFAAYANLGALCCAGLALSEGRRRATLLSAWAVAVNVLACFVSASRGGVLALLLGLGSLLVWHGTAPNRGRAPRKLIPLALVYALLVLLGGVSLSNARSRELLDGDLSKLALLPRALRASLDSWSFGVGRGAFDSVAFRYFPELGSVVLRSVESFVVSFLVEWGIVVGGIALVGLGWLMWPTRLRAGASVRRKAAWLTICVVFFQNLADIGLELPSLSLALWAICGALVSTRTEGARSSDSRTESFRGVATASALGLATLAAALSLVLGPGAFERRRELYERYVARDPGFVALATSSMLASPADPYVVFLAGADALARGEDALSLGALSLRRAPDYGRAHLLVARALSARGAREQAILEFRLAMERDRGLIDEAVRSGLALAKTDTQVERLVPSGRNRPFVLFDLFRSLSPEQWPLLRRRFLREANALLPDHSGILSALLFELTFDLREGKVPCREPEQGHCPLTEAGPLRAELERGLHHLSLIDSGSCTPIRIRALLLELEGRAREGEQLLARQCTGCSELASCVRDRLALADRVGDARIMEAAELTFRSLACESSEACARSEEFLAARARTLGEPMAAAGHLFKAASQSPTADRWLKAARAYLAARAFERAAGAYEQARALGTTDAGIEKELSKLRRESLRDLLQKDSPDLPSGFGP